MNSDTITITTPRTPMGLKRLFLNGQEIPLCRSTMVVFEVSKANGIRLDVTYLPPART